MKALVKNIKTGDYGLLLGVTDHSIIAEFNQIINSYRLSDLIVVAYVNSENDYRELINQFLHKKQVL